MLRVAAGYDSHCRLFLWKKKKIYLAAAILSLACLHLFLYAYIQLTVRVHNTFMHFADTNLLCILKQSRFCPLFCRYVNLISLRCKDGGWALCIYLVQKLKDELFGWFMNRFQFGSKYTLGLWNRSSLGSLTKFLVQFIHYSLCCLQTG